MGVKRHEKLNGANLSSSCKNTHIIGCGALNRRCHYAICVNFLIAVEERRIGESFADCQTALRKGECIAYEMREEEKAKGEALYFVEREERVTEPVERPLTKITHKGFRRGELSVVAAGKNVGKSILSVDDEMIGADMSAVITHAVQEESKKPSFIKPRADEDPIQFAKRYLRESR